MIELTSEEKMFIKMAAHNDVIRAVVSKHLTEINNLATFNLSDDSYTLMERLNNVKRSMIDFCGLFK